VPRRVVVFSFMAMTIRFPRIVTQVRLMPRHGMTRMRRAC
jgi:hypothetical protein